MDLQTGPDAADVRLAGALLALVVLAVITSRVAGLGVGRQQATAAVRAVLQLAAVAAVLTAILSSTAWSWAFVAVMYAVASATALHRCGAPPTELPWTALAIAAGAAPATALALSSGAVPLNGAGIIPVAGILVGGAMTAATLTGRRAFDNLATHDGAYQAALALGLRSPDAALLVLQPSARESLVPGLDQTRTVGLVTLPGAFVGVLLGGGTAVEAATAQLLVLLGLLAAQAVTASVLLRLVAHGRLVRRDLRAGFPR